MIRYINKLKSQAKRKGKQKNHSLAADVSALIFLGISEHPMTPVRWFVLAIVVYHSAIAFYANE